MWVIKHIKGRAVPLFLFEKICIINCYINFMLLGGNMKFCIEIVNNLMFLM